MSVTSCTVTALWLNVGWTDVGSLYLVDEIYMAQLKSLSPEVTSTLFIVHFL